MWISRSSQIKTDASEFVLQRSCLLVGCGRSDNEEGRQTSVCRTLACRFVTLTIYTPETKVVRGYWALDRGDPVKSAALEREVAFCRDSEPQFSLQEGDRGVKTPM